MNLSKPLTSLVPSLEGEVLSILAGAEADFTGQQVHKVLGKHSQAGVNRVLQKLSATGIVNMRSSGNANLYELNREHLLAKYVIAIVDSRNDFYRFITKEVSLWELEPVHVAVFGSAVRGDMTPESDVDIFISRPKEIDFSDAAWREQLSSFASKVRKLTGNSVQMFELGYDDIQRELGVAGGVLSSIKRQGVTIFGHPNYLADLETERGFTNGKN